MKGPILEAYDMRLLEYRFRKGVISKKDYDQFLKSLPDSADNVEYVEVFEEKPAEENADSGSFLTFAPVDANN